MGIRAYQKFDMIVASESQYSWASTDYSNVCLTADNTIPTGFGIDNYASNSFNATVTDAVLTESFIVPQVFDVLSIMDGTIKGTLKINAATEKTTNGLDASEITKAEVGLTAIDSDGNTRTIAAKQEVWTGSIKAVADGTGASTSKQIMYWIDVEDVMVYSNERIRVDFDLTYTITEDNPGYAEYVRIYCTQDTDETTITLPFVM